MAMVLLSLLISFAEGLSQNQSTVQEWQGEWGQWSSDGRGHIYGASISIFNCDPTALTCRFRYTSESAQSSCRSSGDTSLLRISDSRGKGQFFHYDGAPAECYLELEKIQTAGKKGLRLLGQSGTDCANYCIGTSNFPSAYEFKTQAVYPQSSEKECYADPRKAREIWCTDHKIQELDQEFDKLQRRIDTLNHTKEYRKLPGIREEIFTRCEGAADVRECLLSSFTKVVSDMDLLKKSAQEAHDREQKALLTPGDPVKGSELIGRIEGVYKKRFKNKMADETEYTSENVLEIVRVSKDAVYFRTRLQFYNGASCGLSGLARYSIKGVLVFDDPKPPSWPGDEPCRLQIEETAKEVRMLDPGGPCARSHCGIRGGFGSEAFSVSARRPIRYLKQLKNSRQYKEALKQLKQ